MNDYLIYKHTSPSGKAYIGQTNNYKRRCREHQCDNRCIAFHNAINHYGWDNFVHEILYNNLTLEQANELEALCIAEHNTLSPNGYNLTTGGLNSRPSEETRAKIAENQKKSMTPERRAKVSEFRKGKKHTPETRAKMSAGIKKSMTPERRAKISADNKCRIISSEALAKLALVSKNRSPESRAMAGIKGAIANKSNTFTKMQTTYLRITLTEQQYTYKPLAVLLGVARGTIKSHFQTNPVTAKQVHDYFNQPNPYTT